MTSDSKIYGSQKLAAEKSIYSMVLDVKDTMELAKSKNAISYDLLPFALVLAKDVDRRRMRGDVRKLDGVTFTIKDNLWLKNVPATFGSQIYADFKPSKSSYSVERLISLGAIPLAITRCSEFACIGVTTGPLFGDTLHPKRNDLTPGGSSGGAATSCSLGLGDFALATDAGGSTRRPAALTGLVGLKPTTGLIPNEVGFKDPNFLLSSIGIIANHVEDVRIILRELAAYSATDILSVKIEAISNKSFYKPPVACYSQTLGCGYSIDYEVEDLIQKALLKLVRNGWNISINEDPFGRSYSDYYLLGIQQAALAAFYGDSDLSVMHPSIVEQIMIGKTLSGTEIVRLLYERKEMFSRIQGFLENVDVLICPSVPTQAWSIDDLYPKTIRNSKAGCRDHAVYTPLFNYVGCPAISLPIGETINGLPIGLQFVTKVLDDSKLLEIAKLAEQVISSG